jgi:hypothetical protein
MGVEGIRQLRSESAPEKRTVLDKRGRCPSLPDHSPLRRRPISPSCANVPVYPPVVDGHPPVKRDISVDDFNGHRHDVSKQRVRFHVRPLVFANINIFNVA